ncbi:hypothetical protein PPYR_03574 [Photinus pyralis]|uniref:Odorant receptor n=2 Tax=Photinus pyralis TaxID=7054 RepID=A0A5N4A359_PHOPY|nr:hypothetical protein PPYR_03574 [Photinus pyralis]
MADEKLLSLAFRILGIVGLSPFKQNTFAKIRAGVGGAMCFCLCVLTLIEFPRQTDGVRAFRYMVEPTVGSYQSIIKALSLVVAQKRLLSLAAKVGKFKNVTQADHKLRSEGIHKRIGKLIRLYIMSFCTTGAGAFILALWAQDRVLPCPVYYFESWRGSPEYEIAVFLELLWYCCVILTIAGWDIMFYSFATYIYCELEAVKHEFRNMKAEDLENGLEATVRHHQMVLSCIPDLNSLCSVVFLNQCLSLAVAICAPMFMLAAETWSISLLLQELSMLVAVSGQLFCACLAGSLLTDQSESLATEVFHASSFWLGAPIGVQKQIVVIMQRSQKRDSLSLGGFGELNLHVFTQIMKLSLSFLNVILALKTGAR